MRTTSRILLALALLTGAVGAPAQTSPWNSGTYAYDGAGNIKGIGADYYIYDQAGRLIQGSADKERTGGNSFQTYTYDMYGNRTTASTFGTGCIGGCGAFLDIDENNHVRPSSHGASYDGSGSLTQFDNYQYSYDAAEMMTRVRLPNTTLDNQYIYTADDERLATYIAPGQWRFTVRDFDGKVLREVTATEGAPALWSWDRDHVFRDGQLLATVLPSNLTQHYHLDHLGTPKLVTGNGGVKLGVHAYYPFGEELALGLGQTITERINFTGQERDINGPYDSALDYMHARSYMPSGGRFLRTDPLRGSLRRPQSWNGYSYALNDPLRYTDPFGLTFFDWLKRLFHHGCSDCPVFTMAIEVNSTPLPWSPREQRIRDIYFYLASNNGPVATLRASENGDYFGTSMGYWQVTMAPFMFMDVGGDGGGTTRATVEESVEEPVATGFRGNRGGQLSNADYQVTRNTAGEVNGVEYSGHAFDQMQNRGIMPSVVENTKQIGVEGPGKTVMEITHYDPVNNVTVISNATTGRIVSVRYGKP